MALLHLLTLNPSGSFLKPHASSSSYNTTGIIVVGAGLVAVTRLTADNEVIKASDSPGVNVRTDADDGFLLDCGFQIFITVYFSARIFFSEKFHTVDDLVRHVPDALRSLANPIGSIRDKLLITATTLCVLAKLDPELLAAEEALTIDLFSRSGFSAAIIAPFFQLFFGSIFFNTELETTSASSTSSSSASSLVTTPCDGMLF